MALQDADFMATDDCGVVNKYLPQEPIYVVRGEESNMKLTYKEDIFVIDKLFQLQSTALHENIDMSMLQDMVIVIFGGTSGIGAEVTRVAQEYGAHVFSFSRSMGVDISNRNDVKNALKKVFENTGRINFVVNSAAILVKEPLAAMQHDVIEKMIASNYCGMVNVAAESYEYLRASQGQLLLYTSSSYTRGRAFYSIYSSTKAAVVNFAQALAQEWECHKIRVNAINPERTNTPMRSKNFGSEPADTLLSAAEVAHASLKTLLSCFTGQVVDVKLKRQ
jgi:2-C-methyl-D-erythritol 4-phosphate cytidylyltransferase